MRFFYFLHFTSDAGHIGQLALHIPTGKIYSRVSYQGGAFTSWRRLDVSRLTDGTMNEICKEALKCQYADTTGRLKVSVKVTFTGNVTGEFNFDGSQNANCALTIPNLASILSRLSSLESRMSAMEGHTHGGGGDW